MLYMCDALADLHAANRDRPRTMNRWTSLFAASMLAVTLVTPAWARTVRIEIVVPLADHSEEALKSNEAGDRKRGHRATSMGLSSTWIAEGWALPDALVLWIVATDEDANDDDDEGQDGDVQTML
jgi:hypothetical protein